MTADNFVTAWLKGHAETGPSRANVIKQNFNFIFHLAANVNDFG